VASENTPAELIPDGAADQLVAVHLDDFVAYMPMHNYVFLPTREPWPAASVNARIPAWAPSTAS
jgi:hypothetical protein